MNTNENNILIAEFMQEGSKGFGIYEFKGCFYNLNQLKFHTSWDWLIPVANEIIKSRDEQNAYWDLTNLKYALQTTNIELVYKAVVEFIKNQNN